MSENSTMFKNSTSLFDFKRLVSFEFMPYIILSTIGILAGTFGNINL